MGDDESSSAYNSRGLVFVAEFFGCLFFTFCASLNNTALTNATVLACWVYFSSHVSSAHLNPAVTLAFVLLGHHHPKDILVYLFAQVFGCLTGATFVKYLVPHSVEQELGCFSPMKTLNSWQVFGFEFLLTMSFITSIFVVVFYTREKLGFGNMGPLLIGLSLLANALAGGNYTGAALNPARVIASPIVIGCGDDSQWLHAYIIGEFLGAIGAVSIVILFFGVNANAWYIKWLREEHKNAVPAFNYSLDHDKAPRSAKARTRTLRHLSNLPPTPESQNLVTREQQQTTTRVVSLPTHIAVNTNLQQ